LEILLLLVYSALFLLIVGKTSIFKTETLSKTCLVGLAALKIVAGLFYYYLYSEIPTFIDSGYFLNEANIVYSSWQENPMYYFQLVFGPNNYLPEPEHLCNYIDAMGLWYDWGGYSVVRINALLRPLTMGYLSVHFLFFTFFSFIGAYYLFKFFERYTGVHEYLIVVLLFAVPSVLFWTSGMHKEALVMFLMGTILHNLGKLIDHKEPVALLVLLLCLAYLGLLRFYMLGIVFPAIVAYYWSEKTRIKAIIPFVICYLCVILFTILFDSYVPNDFRIANEISMHQEYFMRSDGNTSFEIPVVKNSWTLLLQSLPHALINPFIHPLYNSCISNWCRLASLESIIICILIGLLLFRVKWRNLLNNSPALLCLSIGFSLMLIIGIVVNNAGAIVRYRSIAVFFILMGLVISSYHTQRNNRN